MVSDILTLSIAIQGINNFSSTFRQARQEMMGTQGTMRALAQGAKAAAGAIIMIAAMAAQEFIKSSIAVASEFEISMVRIGAIAGATGKEFDMLTNKVTELGKSTMFTRQEVSEGAKQMAMAGLSADEINASLGSVVAISEVLGLEIGRVAEVATDLGLAFQLNISSSQVMSEVIDQMTATVTNAALSFEQYAQSMTYVSATASAVGLKMDDISAAMGVIANMGIKGSKAGTALNRAIQSIIAPTGKTISVMQKLGLTFNQNILKTDGLIGIVKQLIEAGASAADMLEMFGVRGGRSIVALVNAGTGALEELDKKIEESSGITGELQEKIHETAEFTYKEFAASLEATKGKFGEWLNKGIVPVMRGMMRLGEVVSAHKNIYRVMIAVLAIAIIHHRWLNTTHMRGILLKSADNAAAIKQATGYEILSMSVKKAWISIKAFGVALMSNPITLVLLGITALTLALSSYKSKTDAASESSKNWTEIQVELNRELLEQKFFITRNTDGINEMSSTYKSYLNILKEQLELLEEQGKSESVAAEKIKETINAIEGATDAQKNYGDGIQRALIAGQEWNEMSDEEIATLASMETVLFGLPKSFQYLSSSIHETVVRLKTATDTWYEYKDVIDDINEKIQEYRNEIDYLEKSVEAVAYAHDSMRKAIAMLKFEIDDINSALTINSAEMKLAKANLEYYEMELSKAKQIFEGGVGWEQFGQDIYLLESHIESLTGKVSRYSDEIKYNEMIIQQAQRETEKISASFVEERYEIEQVANSINHMTDVMNRLSYAQTENSIIIRKIQLEARKAGRDLTEEELAEIEALEIANEEKAIKQMELGQQQITAEAERASMQETLKEKIADATAEQQKIITDLTAWNEKLKDDMLGFNIDIADSNKIKNNLLIEQEKAYMDFISENYPGLMNSIWQAQRDIQSLEENEIKLKKDITELNVPLITQEETLAMLMRDQEEAVWEQIDGWNELISISESKLPGLMKKLNESRNHMIEINKELETMKNKMNAVLDVYWEIITIKPDIAGTLREAAENLPFAQTKTGQKLLDLMFPDEDTEKDVDTSPAGLPFLQHGGIAEGPTSGYPVMLHGKEKVTPLEREEKKEEYMRKMAESIDRMNRLQESKLRIEEEVALSNKGIYIEKINIDSSGLGDMSDPEKARKLVEMIIKELEKQVRR